MKKLVSLVLALVLALAMSVSVFAQESPTEAVNLDLTTKSSTTATVDVIIDGQANKVYSVDVSWESLDFAYTFSNAEEWNPEDHTYDRNVGGGWDHNSAQITVTNHSNAGVKARANFAEGAPSVTRYDVTASIDKESFTLTSAVGTLYKNAPSATFACSVSGVPSIETGFTIGTITISIEAVSN